MRRIAKYAGNDELLRKFIYGPGVDQPVCMIDVQDSNAVYSLRKLWKKGIRLTLGRKNLCGDFSSRAYRRPVREGSRAFSKEIQPTLSAKI